MRLGISYTLPHRSPAEWAEKHRSLGLEAVVFPVNCRADDALIDAYADAARARDLCIAEVGIWKNPMSADPAERREVLRYCKDQLALAEHVGAACCVNITGSAGPKWDGGYPENYSPDFLKRVVETVREIVDAVQPIRSCYALEPMPWMVPDSPENYLELLGQIDRPGLGVHLDVINMLHSPKRLFFQDHFIKDCFRLLGTRIRSCHLKDIALGTTLTCQLNETPFGTGQFHTCEFVNAVNRLDPALPVLLEHQPAASNYLDAIPGLLALNHP